MTSFPKHGSTMPSDLVSPELWPPMLKILPGTLFHQFTTMQLAVLDTFSFLRDLKEFFFFLNSVLRPFQDYFSSYETGQSVGGAKTGESREKPPGTPASRT